MSIDWAAVAAGATGLAVWLALPPPPLARLRAAGWAGRLGAATPAARGACRDAVRRGFGAARARVTRRPTRDAAVRASVAQVCSLMAVCLDAGRPPRTALRVVAGVVDGPASEDLTEVLGRLELGVDEAQAWAHLGRSPGYRQVARDLARSAHSGLGLAASLRQHAADARRDAQADALVRARSAGVRSVVPLMVCFLPAFLLLGVVPIFGAVVGGLAG